MLLWQSNWHKISLLSYIFLFLFQLKFNLGNKNIYFNGFSIVFFLVKIHHPGGWILGSLKVWFS